MQTLSNHNLAHKFQAWLPEFGSYFTALFIISIFFSTSVAIIFSAILGLMWLLSGQFLKVFGILKKHPVAAWSFALYLCFIIGFSYGNAANEDAFSTIKKYRELLFIPVLIPFLSTDRFRNRAWLAFLIASVLTLAVSYVMSIGILDDKHMHDTSWKSRITHGIFIAFFAFYCIHKAFDRSRFAKVYLALFLLSVYNLFFIVDGRTGQLIVVALVCLFALQRCNLKGRLLILLAVAVLLGLFLTFSDKANRINEGFVNTQAYLKEHPEQTESSMGQRYTFWKYSLKLIAEKPLLGHGTGSFAKEYQRVAAGERFITRHPHNEFLLIGVQLGLLGLIPYVGFLISQLYYSKKLPDHERWFAQGILTALIITSLFNTPLFDHTEGHWFAAMIALCFAALSSDDKTLLKHA